MPAYTPIDIQDIIDGRDAFPGTDTEIAKLQASATPIENGQLHARLIELAGQAAADTIWSSAQQVSHLYRW